MQRNKAIPTRSEVDPADTWAVEDLFSTEQAWEDAFEAVQDYASVMKTYEGRLGEAAHTLLSYLTTSEAYAKKILRLAGYANLRADEDTANTDAQARKGRFYSWMAQADSETAFETPELLSIPQETLERWMEEEPGLSLYKRFFEQKRRGKEHILSPAEEKLLASASLLGEAPQEIFGSLIYADMKFPSARDLEGNLHELTNSSYISLVQSPDGCLRRNAFELLYRQYKKYRNTFAALLNAQVQQAVFFSRARKYSSVREAALYPTEVPVSVYDNLLKAVHANMDAMYRYTRLRKKRMRVSKLHMYDVYVPLVQEGQANISFEDARDEVLSACRVFGQEYEEVLRQSFEERWMDIYENRGKRSGAYSSFTQVHPFVLLNYKNDLDSLFTLAHEMGHAMHSYLSHKYQPQVYSSYVIFVAEVASTCNEALLMQQLLAKTKDKRKRAILINHLLEQFRSTVYRQTMFAEFEKQIYETVEQGQVLTADVLCEAYGKLNQQYYGPDMEKDPEIEMEWARIPHFYYNFYVYQYATGFAAAIALSRRILEEGEPAVRDYLEFLKGGCSADPITLLKRAGVDMTTAEPVNQALAYFGELVDEFSGLLAELSAERGRGKIR